MHSEFFVVPQDTANRINAAKQKGSRIIAVGTTSVRTLESATNDDGVLQGMSGWTQIFIYPGYKFKMIDALVTNFHLPQSTLLMLISALAGRDTVWRPTKKLYVNVIVSLASAMLCLYVRRDYAEYYL